MCEFGLQVNHGFHIHGVCVGSGLYVDHGFRITFILETNASRKGIKVMLMQDDRPITFLNKALSSKHQSLSIYKKEILTIVMAMTKWQHYLEVVPFIIRKITKTSSI